VKSIFGRTEDFQLVLKPLHRDRRGFFVLSTDWLGAALTTLPRGSTNHIPNRTN